MNEKTIGIIGGMGPEATAFYYMKLIKKTHVSKDQEHFRVIIDSNSKIPDRTRAILYGGDSPLREIGKCIETLNHAAVDVAFVTCITSHFFMDEMSNQANFLIIDALQAFQKHLVQKMPEVRKIGILATTGTIKTGLFKRYLKDFVLIYPDENTQEEKVMSAIYSESYGIKGGFSEGQCIKLLWDAGNELIQQGAQVLVAGCTEVGMVLKQLSFSVPIIDPMECAIEEIIETGGNNGD